MKSANLARQLPRALVKTPSQCVRTFGGPGGSMPMFKHITRTAATVFVRGLIRQSSRGGPTPAGYSSENSSERWCGGRWDGANMIAAWRGSFSSSGRDNSEERMSVRSKSSADMMARTTAAASGSSNDSADMMGFWGKIERNAGMLWGKLGELRNKLIREKRIAETCIRHGCMQSLQRQ